MNLKRLLRISVLTSILSILSIITIPIGPVPITLQSLGIFLCGYLLGSIDGAISVIVYILIGSAGIPIFAGGKAGISVILGPTGGYLFSFIPAAMISGYAAKKYKNLAPMLLSGIICIIVIYLIGVPYLSFITDMPLRRAIEVGACPFLVPDFLKMTISVLLSTKIRERLAKENIL